MSFWEYTRSAVSVRILLEVGQERGLDQVALLAGSRLSLRQLAEPNLEITAAQELAVIRNLVRLSKSPRGLGLLCGRRYRFSSYGIWGYGLISSATVNHALAMALRFLPLTFAFSGINYREEGELAVLRFSDPPIDAELSQFVLERDMAAAAELLREVIGPDLVLARFAFARGTKRPPTLVPGLDYICGVRPDFGADVNCVAISRAYLDRPLPQAEPATRAMCQQMCSQIAERRRRRCSTAELVQEYLEVRSGIATPGLVDLAGALNTSERTLKRRLQAEGTSFRTLLAQWRGETAKQMLGDRTLTLTDIAENLGFSDLSSFSQAFKRWYGVAPKNFRDAGAGANSISCAGGALEA